MDVIRSDDSDADSLYATAMDSMISWSGRDDINRDDYFRICNSLALQTCEYKVNNHAAADYIIRYNNSFAQYGNKDERRYLILYAIDIYNKIYPENKYSAVRENAYENYISYSINDAEHYDEVKKKCGFIEISEKNKILYGI